MSAWKSSTSGCSRPPRTWAPARWRPSARSPCRLSAPGIITGCMLVFILLMGEYLIPQMLGGGKVFFIGNALVDLFLQSLNWPFGSAVRDGPGRHHAGDRQPLSARDRRDRRPARCVADLRPHAPRLFHPRLSLPLRADRADRAVQLQCRAQRRRLPGLLGPMVREGRRQLADAGRAEDQPDRRLHLGGAGDPDRHHGGAGAAAREGPGAADLRRPHLYRDHGAGHRHRHRDPDRARHHLRRRQRRCWRRSGRAMRRCSSIWASARSSPRTPCSPWRW